MTALTSFLANTRARGVTFAAAAATAALIAVLLALANPAPHAGAQTDTMEDLTITVSVPELDGTTAGTNIWSGTSVDVTIARTSGADANCSASSDVVVTYDVDATGAVATTDADLPAQLISMTAGGVACEYTVTFPAVPAGTGDLIWALTTPTAATWSASSLTATGAYALMGDVTFNPAATITVPAGSDGKSFSVDVTSATPGCSGNPTAVTLTYAAADAAATTAAANAANAPLIAYQSSATMSTDVCAYTAAFPTNETEAGATLALQTTPAPDTAFTGTDQAISATYEAAQAQMGTPFTPTVTVSVPQLDGTTASTNIWSGTTIGVTVGQASGADSRCDLGTAVTVTYTVQADGSLDDDGMLPASLTGTLADGTTTCDYTVTFPALADTDDDFDWTLTAPAEATLSGTSTSATGAYTVAEVTFDPDATITVPAGNAAKQLSVSFASSAANCSGGGGTPEMLTYEVADAAATTATADSDNESLVAYPSGVTTVCSYDVTFGANEVGGATLNLAATPAPTATVTGVAQAISATYTAAPVSPASTLPPPVGTTTPASGAAPTISATGASGSGVGSDIGDDDDDDAFAGFVPSVRERVPISVSLTLPATSFDADATVEVLVSAPGACGSDMSAFGGVPAQVGLAYAVSATSGATADVIAAGAQQLAQFAERGTQQEPCALRVTVLSAPTGCTLTGGTTDSAGRSYTELTWRTGTEALALTPSLTCDGTAPAPEPEPEPAPAEGAEATDEDGEASDGAADDAASDDDDTDANGDATAEDGDANGDDANGDGTDADDANGDDTNGDAADGEATDGSDNGDA